MTSQKIKALIADYLFKTIGYVPDDNMWHKLNEDIKKLIKEEV